MDNEGVYNIGVVSRMTGIPENTLRVWERRYGFPKSERTEGGHRLFTSLEVARIKWVTQRIDEGMQTSNAIRALEQSEHDGLFADLSTPLARSSPISVVDEAANKVIQSRLFDALAQHNEMLANRVISEALAAYSIEDLIHGVIAPTFTAIGEAWHREQIHIATEHFATNHLRRQMLMWLQAAPPPYPVRHIILACAPDEMHEGGLIMLAVLLRRLRWPVLYLGQSVDFPDLAGFIHETHPAMIVFVAMIEETAQNLSQWSQWLPSSDDSDVVVAFGGYIFTQMPYMKDQIEGMYLGDTLADGILTINQLMHERNPLLG